MKMLLHSLLIVALASPALAAPPPTRSGEQIARQDCGACHATGRTGASKDPAAPPFRTLANRYDVEGLAEALAEGISVGHPKMPEFAYPPDQIDRLIGYLKSLQPTRPRAAK